ncbi:uncharacterized protein LOC8277583 isoform X2 [Ricinus communis]|uniref:uncharacterized protein LOC8277583 isoform X2 n=1 Tax=Ricinus communis TaxID=3988 RepID=UPI000D687ABB|nr:uncharacterized protein LOC8277583 isoform X2 [Ricinus communis]|eukprot:XP_025014879.1 uncharacterized protein LOC8277583 isoform X2 [Ricinus communis]
MEAAVSSSLILTSPLNTKTLSRNRVITGYPKSTRTFRLIKNRKLTTTIAAVNEVSAAADSGQVEVTWQIIVGAVGKWQIAQRRCEICGGAGLVMREKDYFRCPGCGGFLPWQSWKRFFSG